MRDDAGDGEEVATEPSDRGWSSDDREFRPPERIEPGTPELRNALFVIFGAYLAVLALSRPFVDSQGFEVRNLVVLTGGLLLVSVIFLGFFGLLTPDT